MKTKLAMFTLSTFLLGMVFAFIGFTSVSLAGEDGVPGLIPYEKSFIDDDSNGDGTTHYYRTDDPCPNSTREKTYCEKGGEQLCTPKYCN